MLKRQTEIQIVASSIKGYEFFEDAIFTEKKRNIKIDIDASTKRIRRSETRFLLRTAKNNMKINDNEWENDHTG